jgi:mannose-6-phosphate isomerase-like protein (cupin superfamily)
MKIQTKDVNGQPNGWLMPLWNATERPDARPEQVYLTAVAVGCAKGPHLHLRREQRYYCIRGSVKIVARPFESVYEDVDLSEGDALVVFAGVPSQIINMGTDEAWIINMPAPAWTPEDPDEHPVDNWTYEVAR